MCEGSNWNISEVNVIEETSKQERTKKKRSDKHSSASLSLVWVPTLPRPIVIQPTATKREN